MFNNKQEYILCAAIYYVDTSMNDCHIICGYRHSDCMHTYYKLTYKRTTQEDIQGFLTSKNRFVDRAEAADIAYKAGQIKDIADCLISEDVW